MPELGSPERPLAVAIIGAGPSGFYAAEALLKAPGLTVRVDLFDRLPTPYGLVRGGVAPDHQKIKSVAAVYERTARDPRLRFFGAIKLGRDITAEELAARHDAVIYAVGCESDRHMGIPGEDLAGSHSATEFVGWYNGHPDHHDRRFDLGTDAVAVVGVGNVAMDVTRLLARDASDLAGTDIAGYALDALRKSGVKTVWLLGRRGPAEAAYSPAEIEEIGGLASADLVVDPGEAAVGELSRAELSDPSVKKKTEYVQERAKKGEGAKERKVRLRFLVSPVELTGESGRVAGMRLEKNKLVSDDKGGVKAVGTGVFETIKVGLVLRSVGYRGIPVPGVPFDEKSGHIPHVDGRVVAASGQAPLPGQYVVGWAKRGPSGLIGTNRADSVLTVQSLLADLKSGALPAAADASLEATLRLLADKKVRALSFSDWQKLDALEKANGAKAGKIREKFTRVADMLAALSPDAPRA
ncbi:MAG: FAD-dependent oxidoreductase [Elusimicrobia bacterium]|nr:FAD-dependent oxidoreductase [Elusimicrobiota bacterium]